MIKAMTTEIYHPKVGEAIRIGEHMHNFTLALSDALMASVKMSSVGLLHLPSALMTGTDISRSSRIAKLASLEAELRSLHTLGSHYSNRCVYQVGRSTRVRVRITESH